MKFVMFIVEVLGDDVEVDVLDFCLYFSIQFCKIVDSFWCCECEFIFFLKNMFIFDVECFVCSQEMDGNLVI